MQDAQQQSPPPPRLLAFVKTPLGLGVAGAIALVVIGVVAYFTVLPLFTSSLALNPPEHSSHYYPDDTLVYAWLTLYPGEGQREHMEKIWDQFNEFSAFRNQIDDLYEDFERDTDTSFEEEVLPWIGPELSFGVLQLDRNNSQVMAATVDVRDNDAAADFLDQYLDYREDTNGGDFDSDEYESFDIWVNNFTGEAYALSSDLLVLVYADDSADTEDKLEEMLDLAEGEDERSLANESSFIEARAALSDVRFTSLYVSLPEAIRLGAIQTGNSSLYQAGESLDDTPEWIVTSAGWVERGIVADMVIPNSWGYGQTVPTLSDSSDVLSNRTLAFVSASFDPKVDNWRSAGVMDSFSDASDYTGFLQETYWTLYLVAQDQMNNPPRERQNPDLADILDLSLELVDNMTGIDLETDFFDHLEGQVILAVEEFEFDRVRNDPGNNPVDMAIILSYRSESEEALADTLAELPDIVEDYVGLESDSVEVGADYKAEVIDLEGSSDYAPGYVLHDGYLTFASTDDMLETVVKTQEGGEKLNSAEYELATGYLPGGDKQLLAWVNLHRIVGQMEADSLDLPSDQYRLLRDSVGSLAVSFSADANNLRTSLALTFFPEQP